MTLLLELVLSMLALVFGIPIFFALYIKYVTYCADKFLG